MDEKLKHRIVGGIVLLSVAVIVVPVIFVSDESETAKLSDSTIPPNPQANLKTVSIPVINKWEKTELADVVPEPIIRSSQETMNIVRNEEADVSVDPVESESKSDPREQPTVTQTRPGVQKQEPTPVLVTPKPKPQMVTIPATGKAWAVQVGSFAERANAERLRDKLIKSGYRAFVSKSRAKNRNVVRVRVGPELVRSNADKLSRKLQKELSLQTMVVEHR